MLHLWVEKYRGKPKICEHCGKFGEGHQMHWANKDGKYRRSLKDWLRLCVSCHVKYDKQHKLKGNKVSRNPKILLKLKGY